MPREFAMSQAVAPTLYQEVQLSPTPSTPSSIVNINIAPSSQQLTLFGAGRKRNFDEISGLDEESFARKHLATEASVFFRRKNAFPRSFLWRVLNDGQLLELQCVDLIADKSKFAKDERAKEKASLTFHITFSTAIAKGGVAFADVGDSDALDVFVLTTGYELFTIRLRETLLSRPVAPSNFDATKVVKKFAPGAFSYRYPYRMLAVSSLEIILSLHDGGILRLQRQPNEDGSSWQETLYSEGGWTGSLRALNPLKRRHTVPYGGLDLDSSAVADMAKSPDGIHLWTVSLDHTLKAWDTKTGKIVQQMDLATGRPEHEGPRRQPHFLMAAEQGTIMRVVQAPSTTIDAVAKANEYRLYHLFIHSPEDHQFKIYEIRTTFSSIDGVRLRCVDVLSHVKLIPPIDELLNTNIWHLGEFHVKPGPKLEDTKIWMRARAGTVCGTFAVTFDPMLEEVEDLYASFREGWAVVNGGALSIEELKSHDSYPGQMISSSDTFATPTERWIAFLFYPGRFSTASIEAALNSYRKKSKSNANASRVLNGVQQPLQDRLISAITSKLVLKRSVDDVPVYDQYQSDVHMLWMGFYSILEDLHAKRLESLALAFDSDEELPWCVGADIVAPIRANDELEVTCMNTALLEKGVPDWLQERVYPEDKSITTIMLMKAANQLRRSISADARSIFSSLALHEALVVSDDDGGLGIDGLCDKADLDFAVTPEIEKNLVEDVEALSGLGSLDGDIFLQILEDLDDTPESKPKEQNKALCRYSGKLFMAVAQQSLQRNEAILLDLLLLLTFMTGCLQSDHPDPDLRLNAHLRSAEVYDAILLRLRHTAFRQWLASHEQADTDEKGETTAIPLMAAFHEGDWDARADISDDSDMPAMLTNWAKRWTYGVDLYDGWTGYTAGVLDQLLHDRLYDLAADLTKFVPVTPWSTYLRARLHVALGKYDLAALAFNDAADGLSSPVHTKVLKKVIKESALLTGEEKKLFCEDRSPYYQHVASVFEKLHIYSHTADFAAEALQHIHGASSVDRDIARIDARKSIPDSPGLDRIDDTLKEIKLMQIKARRDDIAGRLFNALVQTGRFREAYDALRKTNSALERANLKALVETCIRQDAVPTLLALPLTDELAAEADAILLALSKKTLASGSTTKVQHHQILYAFRTSRGDFRGAAEILHEYLERLRGSSEKAAHLQDPEDETVLQAFLLLINTLACCGEGEGWLLAEPIDGVHEVGRKRRLVTLEEVRREYEAELDRRSEMLQGRFPLVGGVEEMDVF